MMAEIEAGNINCVLVKDLSRFGREYIETGRYLRRILPAYGVRFIALNDNIDTLLDSADDLVVSVKSIMNEYYSRDLSVKIRSAKREKALRGELVTKNCIYGYMLDGDRNIVVDPEAAETVKIIFAPIENSTGPLCRRRLLIEDGVFGGTKRSVAEFRSSKGAAR